MLYKNRWLIGLLAAGILIKLFSLDPFVVERYYSQGIYPYISSVQRILLGWIPFSIGDLLYLFTGLWLLAQIMLIIKRVRIKQAGWKYFGTVGRKLLTGMLAVYVIFNVLWGLNYNRLGIDIQLKLSKQEFTDEDLLHVSAALAQKLNALRDGSLTERPLLSTKRHLFRNAIGAYAELRKNLLPAAVPPYRYPSVKPSIYSYIGNYLGFTGYYNPFSGEAQVNTTVPLFVRPFTTCHEIGHQLGYAKESEANFAGYLSASASTDTSFLYSVYFDMFAYSARYLYYTDSSALKSLKKQLDPGVLADIHELQQFIRSYASPLERAIDKMYSQYLVANEQPSGRMSYNEVVGMLIAYYRKYGRI